MDDITKLILAKYQVENIIELIKDNEYRQYMFMHLNPVFYELERQLTNLTIADKIKKTNQSNTLKSNDTENLSHWRIQHSRLGIGWRTWKTD